MLTDPKLVLKQPELHHKTLDVIIPFVETLQSAKFTDGTILAPLYGYRSQEVQNALYQIGRGVPGDVVTQAKGGGSWHNYGLAFDFALWDGKKGFGYHSPPMPDIHECWQWLQLCCEQFPETVWGGSFHIVDKPHVQITFGLSLDECQKRYKLDGMPGIFKLIEGAQSALP